MSDKKFVLYFISVVGILTAAIAYSSFPFAMLFFTVITGISSVKLYVDLSKSRSEENTYPAFPYILGCISLIGLFLSYLFRIMHWPFGSILFFLASVIVIVSGLIITVTYISQRIGNKKTSLYPFIILLIPFLFAAVSMFFRSGFSEKTIANSIVNKVLVENYQAEELVKRKRNSNAILQTVLWKGDLVDTLMLVKKEADKLYARLEFAKSRLIDMTGGRTEDGDLKGKYETFTVEVYMLGVEGANNGESYKLEKEIRNFYNLTKSNYSNFNSRGEKISFTLYHFPPNTNVAEAIFTLTHLQLEVLQTEEEYYISKL